MLRSKVPHSQSHTGDSTILHRLPRAEASYRTYLGDSQHELLHGTRTELLRELQTWIDRNLARDAAGEPFCLLTGCAGTGKTG